MKPIHALRYERHGLPADVLECVSLDLAASGPGQVLVALRAAPIHYSDLGLINGSYGNLRQLPAVAGREGVGEVVAVGPGVTQFKWGTLVKMPEREGVWREAVVAEAKDLFPIPAGIPAEQAAQAFINPPTAWRLLHDFVKLERGDWLIQNAGNSAVGLAVAQLARHLGLNCVSVVRDAAASPRLLAAGAARVVLEDSGYEKKPAELTAGAPLKLALNAVGGESVSRLCRAVAKGGVVVTYGGAATEPVRFPTRQLIFQDLTLRGFWLDQWARTHGATDVRAEWDRIFELMRAGVISQPVAARFALADWPSALEQAFSSGRPGKVIFVSEWRP